MKVLVAYASRHGATTGIADRIAETLTAAGVPAESREVSTITSIADYDAVVVGSAAYMFHWLKEATKFVKRHAADMADQPVWLFSSGPLGTDLVDEDGRDVFESTRPREFDELLDIVAPEGERVFFGAYDPEAKPVGMAERFMKLMPASKDSIPAGDFRDWDVIDAWANEIALELSSNSAS